MAYGWKRYDEDRRQMFKHQYGDWDKGEGPIIFIDGYRYEYDFTVREPWEMDPKSKTWPDRSKSPYSDERNTLLGTVAGVKYYVHGKKTGSGRRTKRTLRRSPKRSLRRSLRRSSSRRRKN